MALGSYSATKKRQASRLSGMSNANMKNHCLARRCTSSVLPSIEIHLAVLAAVASISPSEPSLASV